MANHYFTSKPTVTSNPKSWTFPLRGQTFAFKSDAGVFSKSEVDFGSRLLIENFLMPEIVGPILDVGCGYGPIGLTLGKVFPERKVEMIDVNERAIELAKENAQLNKVDNVSIYKSDLFSEVKTKGFAAILSNPPIRAGKKVVHQILEESHNFLKLEGELWIVIQKKQGAPSALEKLETLFGEVEVITKKKGYYIIRSTKK